MPNFASYLVMYSAADLLERVRVRQLLVDQHRADRQDRAVAILADDAQEIGVGHAVRLVDLALVVARRPAPSAASRRACPAAPIRTASGLAATSFSTWPVTDASLRLYFSSATILMPAVLRRALDLREPAVAVGVGEADVAHRLHAVRLHVTAIASAISASLCGVLNTHRVFGIRRVDDRAPTRPSRSSASRHRRRRRPSRANSA